MRHVTDTHWKATVEDLYHVPEHGKAELIDGELVLMSPMGGIPGLAVGAIIYSLRTYEKDHDGGYAFGGKTGFIVDLPNRRSFSPDAAWYVGPTPTMKFAQGAPIFAVEVRSEEDYGPAAERAMAKKRDDYFAAGTLVVWDVDLLSQDVIRVYRSADLERPAIYRRGDVAEAEPAVSGWRMPVNDLFM